MKKVKNWLRFLQSFIIFLISGKTQDKGYQAMLGLFCMTGGRSNDWISRKIAIIKRKSNFRLNDSELMLTKQWSDLLNDNGIVSLGSYLPISVCEKIENWASSTAASPKPFRKGLPEKIVPCPEKPIAEGYYFSEEDLVNQSDILSIMTDKSLLNLAQNYLGCEPILSIVAMWWSCAGKFSEDAARSLAQMYHFDMDRPKWLKIFFYINDVSLKNGPHVFVKKTHKTGFFPSPLLAKGYSRLTDAEVGKFFSEKDQLKIVGKKGSAFAEDTRGIHKGLIPEEGARLVLQLEFCNSLYGAQYDTNLKIKKTQNSGENINTINLFPKIYRRFKIVN